MCTAKLALLSGGVIQLRALKQSGRISLKSRGSRESWKDLLVIVFWAMHT
jgi:hypothetical protein